MFIHEFPDLVWLRNRTENGFSDGKAWNGRAIEPNGWPTVILNVKSMEEVVRPNIKGPLTLFLNVSGESRASIGNHDARIDQNSFFLSNNGERYSLEIDKHIRAETFNIHFGHNFCERVLFDVSKGDATLLENPEGKGPEPAFYSQLYPRTEAFNTIVSALQKANKEGMDSPLFVEQSLYALTTLLLEETKSVKSKIASLHSLKYNTKEEVAKRLIIAIDYIHSHYQDNLSLDELAKMCFMSKFHFLRHFSTYTGLTPHQFVNKLRIEKAVVFLKTDPLLPVHQLAMHVGFAEPSSFSRTFYKYKGCYPTQYASL